MYFVLVLTLFLTIYVFILVEDHNMHNVTISNVTWEKYLSVCGYEAFLRDPQAAKRAFNSKFHRKGVSWDGYVVRVNFNEDNPLSLAYHSASMLVKMDKDDRIGVHGPDIGVSISEDTLT